MHFTRLIKISRPRFWIYELGPYALGIAAAGGLASNVWLLPPVILFFLFFTYPANIYIYGINDVYDYETDKRNPKKIAYESLVVPAEHAPLLRHIFLVSVPFLVYAFFLSTLTFLALLAFFVFAGYYSAIPIRAKARPFFDSIFSAGHYVATGVFSFFLVSTYYGTLAFSTQTVIISILAGMCWAISMHAYSAIPDIKADTDAGLRTIATSLGHKGTLLLCLALYVLAGVLIVPYIGYVALALSLIYVFFMLYSISKRDEALFRVYTYFPKINTLAGMVLFFAVVFS